MSERVAQSGVKAQLMAGAFAVLIWSVAMVPNAQAFIYWGNAASNKIGRANLDGTGANQTFISPAPGSGPTGVAVDGVHLYWANIGAGTVSRANLDGSGFNQSFITGANAPAGVATDGAHVYWGNDGTGALGRANLDGSGVNQSFITGLGGPYGVAVDGAHIYWANSLGPGAVGRANLDGSGVNTTFITGTSTPAGPAVDGAHIYWANAASTTIGRANLDGSGVNQSFITGASSPTGVAVDGAHVYWTNESTGTIGRANLDGSGVNQAFITGASGPQGLAVDSPPGLGPPALGFGSADSPVAQGTVSAPQSVTVTNTGAMPLVISGFAVGGANPGDFFASNDTCHAPIASNGTCTVAVRFSPQGPGSRSATLSVDSNDAPPTPVSLSGTAGPLPTGPTGETGAIGQPGPTGQPGATGPEGPAGRDAKVTCKVRKRTGGKVKVTCKVKLVVAREARLRWHLDRRHHTYARGVVVARDGHATVRLRGVGDLPKGRYSLRIAGREQGTTILIG